jgi:hypothetical protein
MRPGFGFNTYGSVGSTGSLPQSLPNNGSIGQSLATTNINYGQDTYDLTDLPLVDTQVISFQNIGLRIARRLTTPYGALAAINDDPDFGYDIFQLLNGTFSPNDITGIKADIENECLKDETIQDVDVTITLSSGNIAEITVDLTTSIGPFSLVLDISDVTYSTLQINQG